MGLIFIFIDGLGIGPEASENPLDQSWNGFELFSGEKLTAESFRVDVNDYRVVKPIDANLGVDGLPQSGTGQTSLFSGENAARLLGRHHGPYPHTKIKPLLGTPSIFGKAKEMGFSCHFMNAYPDRFFEYAEKHNRWSCTTKMCIDNGIDLNREADVREDRAITAEIFQDIWQKRLNIDLPDIDENTAAKRLISAADHYDLILYEYYLTDKAGHEKNAGNAEEALTRISKLLQALYTMVNQSKHTVLICSDHGNVENLSVKTHTRNLVPLMVYGKGAEKFKNAESLTDVTPAILDWLNTFCNPGRP